MNKKICFVAGHSGGHSIPSLTHAQRLLKEGTADQILFFSTTAPLDKKIVEKNPIINDLVLLNVSAVPYRKKFLFPLFIFNLVTAFFKSWYHLLRHRPQKIISMGGYVSLPVCLAGRTLGIPVELYELNAEPGKAVRFLAPFAQKIWIIHPQTATYLPKKSCSLTTYPIRFSENDRIGRSAALAALNFSPTRTTVFILGGSQGSLFLNTITKNWLASLSEEKKSNLQLIHQTGSNDQTDWKRWYHTHGIPALIFDYHHNLAPLYEAADVVITRAGAGTLAELAFFEKKSIVIPLETATTAHQLENAHAVAKQHPELFAVMQQKKVEEKEDEIFQKINSFLPTTPHQS